MKYLCLRATLLCLSALIAAGCSTKEHSSDMLGQKLMLDIRYYCADGTPAEACKTPVTTLLPEIADIIREGRIGGVILFAENLQNTAQIVELTYALQKVAKDAGLPPLFIAIDQEGGRVARLPDNVATRFVGNMAIGATYPVHQTEFAKRVNKGIAKSIGQLGFNVNFAPTVDVNVNADNPVINVRSYGESAPLVAELGAAAVAALQSENILSALKHFPGHGDTHVDSHTGLPRVEHDISTIEEVDLLPFSYAIGQPQPPAMIMTAHIQYPLLDNTEFTGKDGLPTLVPATLSHKILTGLLRDKLGYQGIIVTDALDMAGIAHYVDHRDAVIRTFNAGADIALMPYAIRNPATVKQFWQLYQQWLDAIDNDELNSDEMVASVQRIVAAKRAFSIDDYIAKPFSERLAQAQATLPYAENQQTERALAAAALTKVYDHGVLPLKGPVMTLVMPDEARCQAMSAALMHRQEALQLQCIALTDITSRPQLPDLTNSSALIVGDITPQHSLVEMGGMADLSTWRNRPDKTTQSQWLRRLFSQARVEGVKSVFVALRAPYIISDYRESADAAVATFGYNVTVSSASQNGGNPEVNGAVFEALADGLLGLAPMPGQSPVTIQ
ncbi:glycoside hydrolase family 3 N-terminal domain-containing protein [Alteromonas gilva]|uniref:beta-N-acetylhexosaminidase n=1 Tax=Alteromonas gilva TaxID=2987522 RepID=A0ABT5L8K2_9ALTE|nr:glycoside hydrolase family 3 N-terminal domain-containing protein [Alteromonas gilva]MDC8832193.1 glycoside hydrolase family 3 N-terminal domain-containing protein [Alteromonas gilva]